MFLNTVIVVRTITRRWLINVKESSIVSCAHVTYNKYMIRMCCCTYVYRVLQTVRGDRREDSSCRSRVSSETNFYLPADVRFI